jgi:uncharacterized membrane protein YdbT with pleckstrin-like domain
MVRLTLPNPAQQDEKYLANLERLVTSRRLHIAVLAPAFLQTLGAVLLALVVHVGFITTGSDVNFLVSLLWYFALFMILRMLWKVTEWHLDHITITSNRLMKVSGILKREVKAVQLSKITDITYTRDLAGRIFGYGEFDVESSGQDQALKKIHYIPKPDRLYLTLVDMIFGEGPKPAGDD